MSKKINEQQLKAICDVLAHTDKGLTKSELTQILHQTKIIVKDDGSSSGDGYYKSGLSKRKWLFNCFAEEINRSQSYEKIFMFIQKAINPISYTNSTDRSKFQYLFEEINKVLLFMGFELDKSGKINNAVKAETLDEVDRRVNDLNRQLYLRSIHSQVKKYCIKDYLRRDYYDAVFEAAKGLAERVRDITGLKYDGGRLFQTAFSRKDPYIFFNKHDTESEKSEFTGLKELLEAIFHLVRNPVAHTPKVNWIIEESKALDILTVISFAHKYLDECYRVPKE